MTHDLDTRPGRDEGTWPNLLAGTLTALVLLPQAIAFAQLAGLPVSFGLAASMLPPIVYALLGSSRVLAVGPVSVAALMVASALAPLPVPERPGGALVLAVEVGLLLLAFGVLRLGLLVNLVSQPVLTGFTSGAAWMIVASQVYPLLGLAPPDPARAILDPALSLSGGLVPFESGWPESRWFEWVSGPALFGIVLLALTLGVEPASAWLRRQLGGSEAVHESAKRPDGRVEQCSLLALLSGRLPRFLHSLSALRHRLLPRLAPIVIVALATLFLPMNDLGPATGYAVVGPVERVLPLPTLAAFETVRWSELLPSAALIALIGFIESIAIAKSTVRVGGGRIDPDRELIALGAANLAGGLTGAMPVAGGFSRTMVNVAAGARSQRASVVTALWLMAAGAGLASLLSEVPKAALAALLIAAVLPLLDPRGLLALWRYDTREGIAATITLAGTVVLGVETGMALGIVATILLALWRSSRPHIAIIGRLPGSQVFRNVERHAVETWPGLLLVRPDESLTFANADFLRQFIDTALDRQREVRTVVLVCSAVNHIDASAEEALHALAQDLRGRGLRLVLTEVKGPVMDRLARSPSGRHAGPDIDTDLCTTLERLTRPQA